MPKAAEKVNKIRNFKVGCHQLATTFKTYTEWSNFFLKFYSFLTYSCYICFLFLWGEY